ncbi:MAG: polymerase, sigma-24 subunit, subfamily [Frankiales bacterium]|nr:polymerase, sigma-24 subunit, subfamily [Frankiales bacterium]
MSEQSAATRLSAAEAGVAHLFHTHRLAMVRLASLLVDDLETAEDVTQDAFAALHRRWPALRGEGAAVSYLRTCVVNGSRSVLRRRHTVRRAEVADESGATAEAADTSTLLAEEHRAVLAAMRELPERQREVIVLRYWSQLSEAEIADALGISVGAVKSSASRGRDAIARRLEESR